MLANPKSELYKQLLACTGARAIASTQTVQTLWSGYGEIVRCQLAYSHSPRQDSAQSVIVKYIQPPTSSNHPRGWNSDASHQRKLESYRVEAAWYSGFAKTASVLCAMPDLYASQVTEKISWLILEDLDFTYPLRKSWLEPHECKPCLRWLARFHALHMHSSGTELWPTGCYWHLQTRHDELEAMADGELKAAAYELDEKLNNCQHKTLVHGDAKLANFCFSETNSDVAMVDFQYVGRGCGMRDVAYFLGSCLQVDECERHAHHLVDTYFDELRKYVPESIKAALEDEWRSLYATAWADFHRFLAGWMPEHQKINRYTMAMTQQALAEL